MVPAVGFQPEPTENHSGRLLTMFLPQFSGSEKRSLHFNLRAFHTMNIAGSCLRRDRVCSGSRVLIDQPAFEIHLSIEAVKSSSRRQNSRSELRMALADKVYSDCNALVKALSVHSL